MRAWELSFGGGGSAMVYKFRRGMKIVKKLKKVRNEN